MSRVIIPATALEFEEGGHTIWVHGKDGGTILRIKLLDGRITSEACTNSPISHADIAVRGVETVKFCLSDDARKGRK
jgi:hypothetical protein